MLSARLLLCAATCIASTISLGSGTRPGGAEEVTCDVPAAERIENIGSRVDGAGMCVTSSVEQCARWAGLDQLRGLRDYCARQPGGCYPAKLDRQYLDYCREKGVAGVDLIQYQGSDPAFLDAALGSGRACAVTYSGHDKVRYRGYISHMVTLVFLNPSYACLLDNNGIGENQLLWMTRPEFLARWADRGGGWAATFAAPGPPPAPFTAE